jgi:hypothetical protein
MTHQHQLEQQLSGERVTEMCVRALDGHHRVNSREPHDHVQIQTWIASTNFHALRPADKKGCVIDIIVLGIPGIDPGSLSSQPSSLTSATYRRLDDNRKFELNANAVGMDSELR